MNNQDNIQNKDSISGNEIDMANDVFATVAKSIQGQELVEIDDPLNYLPGVITSSLFDRFVIALRTENKNSTDIAENSNK